MPRHGGWGPAIAALDARGGKEKEGREERREDGGEWRAEGGGKSEGRREERGGRREEGGGRRADGVGRRQEAGGINGSSARASSTSLQPRLSHAQSSEGAPLSAHIVDDSIGTLDAEALSWQRR